MSDLPETTAQATATLEKPNGVQLCGKNKRGGRGPCEKTAGWGTYHPGSGPCRLHGGATPVKHGLYSKQLKNQPDIQERIQELKTHPELLDIQSHLAVVVAISEKVIEQLSEPNANEDYQKTAETLATVIDKISKIKEREHKIAIGYYYKPEQIQQLIQLLAARIQRTCVGCPQLHQLAKDIESVPMPE